MSAALERVIAEQQKEIDDWKERDLKHIEAWQRHNKRVEDLVGNVFLCLDDVTDQATRQALINCVRALGYCTTCESAPCECDWHD